MSIDSLTDFSVESEAMPPALYSASVVGLIEPLSQLQHKGFQHYEDQKGNQFINVDGRFFGMVSSEPEPRYFPLRVLPQQNSSMIKGFLVKMEDRKTGEVVAAKTEYVRTLLNEAEIMTDVVHPNIVSFVGLAVSERGEIEDSYLIMEWLSGGTLEGRMRTDHLSVAEIASVIDQVAAALSHINHKGYIYADTKPANIMFNEDGQVKLVDFENTFPIVENGSTAPDIFCLATYNYASPEQRALTHTGRGRLYIQSDVYSLAAVLFEMLTHEIGGLTGIDRDKFIIRYHEEPLPLRPEYQAMIPASNQERLARILRRALAFDYQARQASVEEFNNEVQEVLK